MDNGAPVFTLKLVGGTSFWQINHGGSDFQTAQAYQANVSLSFSFTLNEDGTYSYVFESANGDNLTANNTISGIDAIKLQSTNQGSGHFFTFDNLSIDSKYTIAENNTFASDLNISVPYLDVQSGSTLNIGPSSDVSVTGDLKINGILNIASGSSLRVGGTSSGNITYKQNLGTANWYIMSPPVSGVTFNDTFVNNNNITRGKNDASNRAVASYVTSNDLSSYLHYQWS